MRYLMKQKVFALGSDFVIKDSDDRDVFVVDGKAFSIGSQLSFQDLDGHELAFIRQKLLSWSPRFEVTRDGELAALVTKELFSFLKCRFTVDVPGPDDLEAEGDFLDHEYAFTRGGRTVATVSKRWFTFGDTYGVDILPDQDDVLILASTIVVDMACHHRKHG